MLRAMQQQIKCVLWILTGILRPLIFLWLYLRCFKGREDRLHLKNRYGRPTQERPAGNFLWVHAASVGEVVSVLPLLEKLSQQQKLLVTTTTLTGKKILQQRMGNYQNIIHQFAPFDVLPWIQRFLSYWQPTACLLIESEIWPSTLLELKTRQIPVLLINARLSPKTRQRWKAFPRISHALFSIFNTVTASTDSMVEDLKQLGSRNIHKLPHLKYAAAPLPYDQEMFHFYQKHLNARLTWVAASTHPGEDEIVLAVHARLKETFPNLLTIIVPRHPKRVMDIEKQTKNLKTLRHTARDTIQANHEILIVDTLGDLGLFYALSPISLVAGNLVPNIGGHNPIEPALFGNAILWGPYTHKSQDVCDMLSPGGICVQNADELYQTLFDLLQNPEKIKERGSITRQIVEDQSKSLDTLTGLIARAQTPADFI